MRNCFLTLVLIVVLISMSMLLQSCVPQGAKEQTIAIGAAGPLSGDQAQIGQDVLRGVELAIDQINASGGLLGKKVVIISLDDKADPKEASNVASKFVADANVVAVVGHLNSGCSIPASDIYNRAHMAMISASSTADDLTSEGKDNVFRVVLRDSDQGPAGAVFAKEKLGAQRVAILDDKTAYGKGLAEAFKAKAVELGMEVVGRDAFDVGNKDFSTLVTKLIAAQPDVIFIGGMYPETSLLVKQARPRGLTAVFMSGDGAYVPKLIEIAGDAAEGLIASFLAPPWNETPAAVDFLAKYKAKYGEEVKSFAPLAYDATMVLAEAIERAGKADRAAIIAALHAPDFSYKGMAATYQFDANGDITTKQPYFYIVKNGKFESYK